MSSTAASASDPPNSTAAARSARADLIGAVHHRRHVARELALRVAPLGMRLRLALELGDLVLRS